MTYFLEAVKTGSLNKASRNLDTTHQTISTGITNLENELDVQLIIRDKQGVTLTPAGIVAEAYAREVLDIAQRFKQAMAKTKETTAQPAPAGHLNVLHTPLIDTFILPYLLGPFLSKYPKIALHFTELEATEISAALQKRKGDIGIFAMSSAIRNDQKICERSHLVSSNNIHLCAVMAVNHPLAQLKSVSIKTLLQHPLAIYQISGEPGTLYHMLSRYGKPNLVLVTGNMSAYVQGIAFGRGIGFLPKIGIKRGNAIANLDKLVFVPIKDTAAFPVAYALSPALSTATENLCQLFIDEMKSIF